jgi:HNH endonuclease
MVLVGPIPAGYVLDHLCRNRPCVNPFHLELVVPYVNQERSFEAQKEYCKNGHPLSGDNVRERVGTGWRVCRTCVREASKRRRRRLTQPPS